jgi:hypothetical protein
MERIRDWENTKYSKRIRISIENYEYIKKKKKGRVSLAWILENIINKHKCDEKNKKIWKEKHRMEKF